MEQSFYLQAILYYLLQDLQEDQLRQILDFTLFLREKKFETQNQEQRYNLLLNNELSKKTQHEVDHLEQEFENYENLYPYES